MRLVTIGSSIALLALATCCMNVEEVAPQPEPYIITTDSSLRIEVLYDTPRGAMKGYGTCFPIDTLINDDGSFLVLALTAEHCVSDGHTDITVNIPNKDSNGTDDFEKYDQIDVTLLAVDKTLDVALLAFTFDRYIAPNILAESGPNVMDEVLSVGYPFGGGLSIGHGYVGHQVSKDKLWLCSANVSSGVSGGPIYNKETREVIGITIQLRMLRTVSHDGYASEYLHYFRSSAEIVNWLKKEGLR